MIKIKILKGTLFLVCFFCACQQPQKTDLIEMQNKNIELLQQDVKILQNQLIEIRKQMNLKHSEIQTVKDWQDKNTDSIPVNK